MSFKDRHNPPDDKGADAPAMPSDAELLCAFLQSAARRCFDESNSLASRWYGPESRVPDARERRIASLLGTTAEMLQELAHLVYAEWYSEGNGWRR